MSELEKKEIALFTKFLENRKILIADALAATRSTLYGLFRELGTKPTQLFLANSYDDAEQLMNKQRPHVVIAEYDLGSKCGLELFQKMRSQHPEELKHSLFLIVTNNTSQSAVARSLEEDIDGYIIKPYTLEYVRRTVIRAATEKMKPPEYQSLIEQGKVALVQGNFEEAEKFFKEAATKNETPSLAYYYLGQTEFLRKLLPQAEDSYEKGLNYNRIHYKCLVGMYDLMVTQQEYERAYEVVRRIAKYFPANPKRLAEVIRLAIVTGRYEDIERYYNTFTNLSERNDLLIRYACAALIVCGKYYLGTKLNQAKAVDLFKKAVASSAGRINVLTEVISSLLEYKLAKEAHSFLMKFPPDAFNAPEFLLMRFLVLAAQGNSGDAVEQGQALLARGVVDERLFRTMIQIYVDSGVARLAEDVLIEASKHFPDKKGMFEDIIKKGSTKSS